MAKTNTIPARIDLDLKIKIDNIAKKNNLSFPQASKIVAKRLDEISLKKKDFKLDIRF